MAKMRIKTITHNGKWTNIEFEDGVKASANNETSPAFKYMKDGQEVDLVLNETEKDGVKKTWANLPKVAGAGAKFPPKDVAWEKRKASLECAINAAKFTGTEIKSEKILLLAETFHTYINQK